MNRREALSAVSFLLGGTIIGAEAFLSGCSRPVSAHLEGLLTADDISLLDEVGETILPETPDSPGARAAQIGKFMNTMVTDCYPPADQKIFKDGLALMQESCKKNTGKKFDDLETQERHDFVMSLENEASSYKDTRKPEDPETHYYTMIKQLTVLGYFTSEIGATQALRYVAVPGRWDPCVTLQPGDKAWA